MSNVFQPFLFLCISSSCPDFSSVIFSYMFSLLHTKMKMVVWTGGNWFYVFLREKILSEEKVLGNSLLLNVQSE